MRVIIGLSSVAPVSDSLASTVSIGCSIACSVVSSIWCVVGLVSLVVSGVGCSMCVYFPRGHFVVRVFLSIFFSFGGVPAFLLQVVVVRAGFV